MTILNKVGDAGCASRQAKVESLIKVVACYRHLASCVGGCTDSANLRDELRKTREKAQNLAVTNRDDLTSRLRDKSLSADERRETEVLWVAFASSLEQFHGDMCKVCSIGSSFPLSKNNARVNTGIQGDTKEVVMRAMSLKALKDEPVSGEVERLEQTQLEEQLLLVDQMLEDMEQKVNVLRWTVEAVGNKDGEPASTNSGDLGVMGPDEPEPSQAMFERQQIMIALGVVAVVVVAAVLFILIVVMK